MSIIGSGAQLSTRTKQARAIAPRAKTLSTDGSDHPYLLPDSSP